MTNLREVAAFLLGEGELDGVGFGDPHPTERGNYWWRKHLRAALAQPEQESAYGYASRLATAIWEKHYKDESPHWKVNDSLLGVLTQIDNMTTGLARAQPEQEIESDQDHVEDDGCPTEKAVLQRFWREHQKQEPVACPYCHYSHTLGAVFFDQNCVGCVNRMTTPPQREWVGLTDEDVEATFWPWKQNTAYSIPLFEYRVIARAIEAKLKEKNEKL